MNSSIRRQVSSAVLVMAILSLKSCQKQHKLLDTTCISFVEFSYLHCWETMLLTLSKSCFAVVAGEGTRVFTVAWLVRNMSVYWSSSRSRGESSGGPFTVGLSDDVKATLSVGFYCPLISQVCSTTGVGSAGLHPEQSVFNNASHTCFFWVSNFKSPVCCCQNPPVILL